MTKYKFILKFDDADHSFTNEKGLPLDSIAELLSGLFEATKSGDSSSMTLSEIRSSSKALVVVTEDEYEYDSLKVVHKRIGEGISGYPYKKELRYMRALKKLTDSGITLDSFDEPGDFHIRINSIDDFDKERFVSDYQDLVGTISEIGGNKILGKRHIRLDEYDFDILVDPEQDDKLKYFYKDQRVSLYVKVRYSINDKERIKVVELIDFETKNHLSLKDASEDFIRKRGDVFSDLANSVQSVREIRV